TSPQQHGVRDVTTDTPTSDTPTTDTPNSPQTAFLLRAAIGLAQGLAMYWLIHAGDQKIWPGTDPWVFAPLVATAFFVPFVATVGVGNLRAGALALWIAAAIALCVGLSVYGIYREPASTRIDPHPTLWFGLAAGLFIAHSLIVAARAEKKWLGSYGADF